MSADCGSDCRRGDTCDAGKTSDPDVHRDRTVFPSIATVTALRVGCSAIGCNGVRATHGSDCDTGPKGKMGAATKTTCAVPCCCFGSGGGDGLKDTGADFGTGNVSDGATGR